MRNELALAIAMTLIGCGHSPAWDPQHPAPGGPPPPSPSSPAENARVEVPRPTFAWRLPAGESGAVIEICRDPQCKSRISRAEAATRFTPEKDLPSGMVFWRLRGKAGDVVGKDASAIRALAVDTTESWSGKFVDVVVPASAGEWGKKIVPRLDAAVGDYAAMLGVKPPLERVPIFFYTTDQAYDRARGVASPMHEAGFTTYPRRNSAGEISVVAGRRLACHIRFADRLRSDDEDSSGVIEAVTLHELAHAVAYETIPLYGELPAWFVEGLSDLLSSNALAEIWNVPFDRQPLASGRLRYVAKTEPRIPLATLLQLGESVSRDTDVKRVHLLYAESFALLHEIDSASDPATRQRFRAVIRSIAAQSKLAGATSQLRALVGNLDAFEPRWLDHVTNEALFPWLGEGSTEVRVLPAEIAVGATPAHFGMLQWAGVRANDAARVAPGDRVEAVVDVRPGDAASGCLLALAGDSAFAACADNRGRAVLSKLGATTTNLATGRLLPGHFARGMKAKLSLELGAHWIARVDGEVVVDAPAPAVAQAWGVAALSGRSHFLGAHVVHGPAGVAASP